MTKTVYTTREEWLNAARELLEPLFTDTPAKVQAVRLSTGFPSGGRGGSKAGKTIGQCHYAAADGVPQVFIHPTLTDPVKVLDVLAHELAHAYLPVGTGHKGDFVKTVRAIGLVDAPTATNAGPEFRADAEQILDVLGEYPHAALDTSSQPKQTTRMIKVECECGLIFRASRTALEGASMLGCMDRDCDGTVTVG